MAQPVPARLSKDYTAAAGRKFGFTVGIAFGVISAISWWRDDPRVFVVLASLAGVVMLAALVVPEQLRVVDDAWMRLALLISKITTPIFMGIIYFVVLTPVGVLRRAFGKNALVHRAGPHGLWADRSTTPPSSLERLF